MGFVVKFLLLAIFTTCTVSAAPAESDLVSATKSQPEVKVEMWMLEMLVQAFTHTQQEIHDLKQAVHNQQQIIVQLVANQNETDCLNQSTTIVMIQAQLSALTRTVANQSEQIAIQALSIATINQTVAWIVNPPPSSGSVFCSASVTSSSSASPSPSRSSTPSLFSSPSPSSSSTSSESCSQTPSPSQTPSISFSPSISLSANLLFTHRGNILLTGSDAGDDVLHNVTRVEGDVTIAACDFQDIGTFGNLQEITGSLVIQLNQYLVSLTSLSSLRYVGQDLYVWKNTALNSLRGLDSLVSVGGSVTIASNYGILDVSGLGSLVNVSGSFSITNNQNMTSTAGLDALVSVGGSFTLSNNQNMTNFNALGSLVSVGGSFTISNNQNLTSTIGLDSLVSVGDSLEVSGNTNLASVTGLPSLVTVGQSLKFNSNPALTSVTGLQSIQYLGSLMIISNSNLQVIDLQSSNVWDVGADVVVGYNSQLQSINMSINSAGPVRCESHNFLRSFVMDKLQQTGSLTIYNNGYYLHSSMLISLAVLRVCDGEIYIFLNICLTNLQLPLLQTVWGYLGLQSNFQFTTANTVNMTSLSHIGRGLNVLENTYLTNLDFLSSLAQSGIGVAGGSVNVGGAITIRDNGVNCVHWNYIQYSC